MEANKELKELLDQVHYADKGKMDQADPMDPEAEFDPDDEEIEQEPEPQKLPAHPEHREIQNHSVKSMLVKAAKKPKPLPPADPLDTNSNWWVNQGRIRGADEGQVERTRRDTRGEHGTVSSSEYEEQRRQGQDNS